jgi:hypothetical protein
MREKLLYLALQLIKTFSMLDGVQDEIVRQCFDETFELWMSIFISVLQGSVNLNLGIKKYIIKVSTFLSRFLWSSSEICSDIWPKESTSLPIFISFGSLATKYCPCTFGAISGRSLSTSTLFNPKITRPPLNIPISMMTQMHSAHPFNH